MNTNSVPSASFAFKFAERRRQRRYRYMCLYVWYHVFSLCCSHLNFSSIRIFTRTSAESHYVWWIRVRNWTSSHSLSIIAIATTVIFVDIFDTTDGMGSYHTTLDAMKIDRSRGDCYCCRSRRARIRVSVFVSVCVRECGECAPPLRKFEITKIRLDVFVSIANKSIGNSAGVRSHHSCIVSYMYSQPSVSLMCSPFPCDSFHCIAMLADRARPSVVLAQNTPESMSSIFAQFIAILNKIDICFRIDWCWWANINRTHTE